MLYDWRLRECDYGVHNGGPTDVHVRGRRQHLDRAYPGGESWRQAVDRVAGVLADLPTRWNGRRVLLIGHIATLWGLEHHLDGVPLEALVAADFVWREGWEFHLGEAGERG